MKNILFLALAAAVTIAAAPQQKGRQIQGDPGLPNMNLPPGYTAKVEKTTVTYNFHGLTRNLPIPMDRLLLTPSEVPSGVQVLNAFTPPTKLVEQFYSNPASTLASFGTPTRKAQQTFNGKVNGGTIVYLEYAQKLPEDMRLQLAKLFWGKRELLNAPQPVEFAASDHVVIIWNFKNADSEVKNASQRKFFEVVSSVATEKQNATTPKGTAPKNAR